MLTDCLTKAVVDTKLIGFKEQILGSTRPSVACINVLAGVVESELGDQKDPVSGNCDISHSHTNHATQGLH